MVTAVTFFSGSGAMGGRVDADGIATPPLSFATFSPGATNLGNRLGFFGEAGAPSSPVVVSTYQARSHIVDHLGVNLGTLVNIKFTSSTTAEVSGVSFPNPVDTPPGSGTVLCRFTEPTAQLVTTQNATFRAVQLNSHSGVPDISDDPANIDIQAYQIADTNGGAGDTTWSQIAGGGSNSLALTAQAGEQTIHDFEVAVSASPTAAGRKIDFGFVVDLEFL